jgi:hypothetical protein
MNLPLLGIPNAPLGVASGKPIKGRALATKLIIPIENRLTNRRAVKILFLVES